MLRKRRQYHPNSPLQPFVQTLLRLVCTYPLESYRWSPNLLSCPSGFLPPSCPYSFLYLFIPFTHAPITLTTNTTTLTQLIIPSCPSLSQYNRQKKNKTGLDQFDSFVPYVPIAPLLNTSTLTQLTMPSPSPLSMPPLNRPRPIRLVCPLRSHRSPSRPMDGQGPKHARTM